MRTDNDEPEYGYLRQIGDALYLIPEDEIGEHDELKNAAMSAEWLSDEWRALSEKYVELYADYRLEGELYDLRVLLE